MGIYLANGARRTKATVQYTPTPDPLVTLTEDLYTTRTQLYERGPDYGTRATTEGSVMTLHMKAGTVLRQSQLEALFPTATIDTITPTTAALIGGSVATIRGTYLDGVTAITVGGTAGTAIAVVSPAEVRFTVPARPAGTYPVAFVDDSGTITVANALTYA